MTQAYPLQWPKGRTRSRWTESARFKQDLNSSVRFTLREIELMGGSNVVISSNRQMRLDGQLMSRTSGADDTAVAIYFTSNKQQMVFSCDRWDKLHDNIYAIGKTIEAMRGIERWGSKEMAGQAFSGFSALPPPPEVFNWRTWFARHGYAELPLKDVFIQAAYADLAKKLHPDIGGTATAMAELNQARDEALKEVAQ